MFDTRNYSRPRVFTIFFLLYGDITKKKTTIIQVSNYHMIGNSPVQYASVAAAAAVA
jgi:hypothetical protein